MEDDGVQLTAVVPDDVAAVMAGYLHPALALARRVCGDERTAEDVVQEACLAYWRNPAGFDPARGPFGTWFLSTVHHKAVDAVRRETSQRRRLDAAAEQAGHDVPRDLADLVADRLADARVRTALGELPAAQREAIVLAYWGGMSQREIAVHTGAPLGTVKSRMLTAMRRLEQEFAPA